MKQKNFPQKNYNIISHTHHILCVIRANEPDTILRTVQIGEYLQSMDISIRHP